MLGVCTVFTIHGRLGFGLSVWLSYHSSEGGMEFHGESEWKYDDLSFVKGQKFGRYENRGAKS